MSLTAAAEAALSGLEGELRIAGRVCLLRDENGDVRAAVPREGMYIVRAELPRCTRVGGTVLVSAWDGNRAVRTVRLATDGDVIRLAGE